MPPTACSPASALPLSPPIDAAARKRHISPMAEAARPLRIDVVSDIVCPWCFIGKRRLEKALALAAEIPVEVYFHPYFLNDWIPREGIAREEYLTKKFGSPEAYRGTAGRVAQAAAEEGLTYATDKIKRQPNTLDSHRLIHWAGKRGKGPEMKQRLMDLYFTEGADLTNREVLVRAAADIGLDPDAIRPLLESEEDVEETTLAANAAKEAGINGVPTFIFNGRYAVSGAQAPETLADVIRKAAAEA
jgi:predicted DsbA family dithiol-disulfide isomerase